MNWMQPEVYAVRHKDEEIRVYLKTQKRPKKC